MNKLRELIPSKNEFKIEKEMVEITSSIVKKKWESIEGIPVYRINRNKMEEYIKKGYIKHSGFFISNRRANKLNKDKISVLASSKMDKDIKIVESIIEQGVNYGRRKD